MVVTGDLTQIDLPSKKSRASSGKEVLSNVKGLCFHEFDHNDVVRHLGERLFLRISLLNYLHLLIQCLRRKKNGKRSARKSGRRQGRRKDC